MLALNLKPVGNKAHNFIFLSPVSSLFTPLTNMLRNFHIPIFLFPFSIQLLEFGLASTAGTPLGSRSYKTKQIAHK